MKKIELNDVEKILFDALSKKNNEYQRAFHGRGNYYKGFEFLTIDYIDKVLFVVFFNDIDEVLQLEVLTVVEKLFDTKQFECVVLQRRYLSKSPSEILYGILPQEMYAYENGLKFKINVMNNQNIGFFSDMKRGHEYISSCCQDKKVLNLFSYTCAFSVCAVEAGASKVVNVDMSKSALSVGRENHRINDLDTKNVEFMPHNILKSWNKIKKSGPYDIIIIDPPSFQKGSFAATKDYEKIIKRLHDFAHDNCLVLACLNDPRLKSTFIKELFSIYAPQFMFEKRLENLDNFISQEEESSLKNLVFRYKA